MKHVLILIVLFISCRGLYAQTPNMATTRTQMDRFMVDANGRVLRPSGDFNEEGSPYFFRDFLPGSVKILNGNTYHGLQLKINFHTNEIIFLDNEGNEMVVAQPVERVELNTETGKKVFKTGYGPVDDLDTNIFYEVLDSGAVSFLKYTKVTFSERQPYPNAKAIRTYRDRVFYYIAKGTMLQKLPKNTEDIPALFGKKEAKLFEMIRQEHLKLKKENDLIQLFRYANQLQ